MWQIGNHLEQNHAQTKQKIDVEHRLLLTLPKRARLKKVKNFCIGLSVV